MAYEFFQQPIPTLEYYAMLYQIQKCAESSYQAFAQ